MKFETNTLNDKEIQSTGAVKNMKLDEGSQAMIFQMFTGGLYSDPVGTVIREIASNCFDSHVEAGVDSVKNPVVIRLTKEVSGNFISFIDKGVGMSPDRVENIYGNYFKSTKRQTNDQIGGFGLGGKTPLAYTSSFFLITRFDGIEYTYSVFEGNETPAFELLSQSSTTLSNGTEVKIPVKESDVNEFEKKTLRQLFYFENIIFEGFSDSYVTNDYTIIKGENFLFRGSTFSSKMHVCLGKVAYPIDFEALDLNQYDYDLPVAVKLDIGELEGAGVIPSREALKYSPENVKIIKAKMDLVVEELGQLLGKQMDNVRTVKDYYRTVENFGYLWFNEDDSIYLGKHFTKSDVAFTNFKYDAMTMPNYSSLIETFYKVKMFGKKPTRYDKSNVYNNKFEMAKDLPNIVHVTGEFKRAIVKQGYLQHEHTRFYLHTPKNLSTEEKMEEMLKSFGLTKTVSVKTKKGEVYNDNGFLIDTGIKTKVQFTIPKKKAIKLLNDFTQEIYDWMAEVAIDYDTLVVPEDYIELRKNNRINKETLKEGIKAKLIDGHWYSDRRKFKFEQLLKFSGKIYYGFRDDESSLRDSSSTFKSISGSGSLVNGYDFSNNDLGKGTMFIQISKQNEKYMKLLDKKAIHVKYFYHTYVSRKLDTIINNRAMTNISHEYHNNVLEVFKRYFFNEIDVEIYDNVQAVELDIKTNDNTDKVSISEAMFEFVFKKRLSDIKLNIPSRKNLDWLIDVSNKSRDKFEYINMPYRLNIEKKEDQHLIELVSLCINK